jgi:alpha-glucosidase
VEVKVLMDFSAVAEAWVASDRKHHYASPEGLGQSFSFDMLMCDYKCEGFKKTISQSLVDAKKSGSSSTWVLSNHDVSSLTRRIA